MTSIYNFYDFDKHEPPRLTEKMLQEELKIREVKRQTILIGIASILFYICMMLCTILMSQIHVIFGIVGIFLIVLSLVSNGILSFVFFHYRRRRAFV